MLCSDLYARAFLRLFAGYRDRHFKAENDKTPPCPYGEKKNQDDLIQGNENILLSRTASLESHNTLEEAKIICSLIEELARRFIHSQGRRFVRADSKG